MALHTGELRLDAPGVHTRLTQICSSDHLRMLSGIYFDVFGRYGSDYPEVRREHGVSFNPLPARIVQLVLGETMYRQPPLLAAALIAPMTRTWDHELPHALDSAKSVLSGVEQIFRGTVEICEPTVAAVAAAIVLDRTRHLHMSNLSREQIVARLDEADSIMKRIGASGALGSLPRRYESSAGMQKRRVEKEA